MGPSGMYGLSASPVGRRPSKLVVLVIVLGVLLLGTIIASIVAGQISNANRAPLERFSARLTNLTSFITTNETPLRSEPVAKASAEARVISESAASELKPYLIAKPSKSILTNEADTSSADRLSDATKTGTYDSEYQAILKDKLESTEALMNEVYNKSANTTFKTILQRYYNDYNAVSKQL